MVAFSSGLVANGGAVSRRRGRLVSHVRRFIDTYRSRSTEMGTVGVLSCLSRCARFRFGRRRGLRGSMNCPNLRRRVGGRRRFERAIGMLCSCLSRGRKPSRGFVRRIGVGIVS